MNEPTISLDEFEFATLRDEFDLIINESGKGLAGLEHDLTPLLEGIGKARLRDALLLYVITDGDEATVQEALDATPYSPRPLSEVAMDAIIWGKERPNGLTNDVVAYLRDYVHSSEQAYRASDEVKSHLFSVGAVLTYWQNDMQLRDFCLDQAALLSGNHLAYLIQHAVRNNIIPAWVTQ